MAVKARSYVVANTTLTVLGVFAWIQIIMGVVGILGRGMGGGSQLELTFSLGLKFLSVISVFSGLISLALVQMARANIHSAEINWEMLEIIRKNSSVEKGTSRVQKINGRDSGDELALSSALDGEVIKVYLGHSIIKKQDGVFVSGRNFASLVQAERWLDGG